MKINFITKLLLLFGFSQAISSECGNYISSQLTVRILSKDSIPNSVIWVKCDHNSTQFDLSFLLNCSFPSVTIARFDFCNLEKKLEFYLTILGVNAKQVKEVVISAPKVELNSTFQLNSNFLQGFSNLTSFIVYNGNISSVSDEAFKGVPNLKRLILNDNLFETLPPNVFINLNNLKLLIINNQLTTLPENLFSGNANLEILHLYSNKLRNLPVNIFNGLTALKTLSLSNNNISNFNETLFTDCLSLESVNLSKNYIRNLSSIILNNCTKLEIIDLSNNNITSIPITIFKNNYNLKKIILDNNSLISLPENLISHLQNLQNISVSNNKIKSLPHSILHNNPGILSLELKGNYINSLPAEFFKKSHSIKVVDLSKNNLTVLPDGIFSECLSLENLKLNANNLNSLSLNYFPPIASNLKEINLSRNRLKLSSLYQFGSFVLANQISLNHLDLSFNQIEQMPYALYTLSNLKYLNLENNNITYFSLEFLREIISRGVTVNVRNNSIATISTLVLYPLETPAVISISGNPLNCDCKLFDFVDFLRGNKRHVKNVVFTDINNLKCIMPGNMNGTQLKTVETDKLTCQIPAGNISKCSTMCDCVIQPSSQNIFVNCSGKKLTKVPPLTMRMRRPSYGLSVDLSSNHLTSFNFSHPSFLLMTNLSLANNSISDANVDQLLSELPSKLKYLSLRHSNLTKLKENFITFIENKSLIVDLAGHQWQCNCYLKPLHTFLQTKYTLVHNVRDVFCFGYNKPVIDLTAEEICLATSRLTAIILLPMIAIILAVLGTVAFFKYQTSLRVWLYSKNATRWLVTEKDLDADKEYDAFLSYSHEDEEFINETLVPGLENGDPKYKVCLHYRDWRPGELIQTQILESVANSRRTIVVLSKNFIKSVWGKMEFRVAHQKALKDDTNRVIVIVYGEMPPLKMLDDELTHYVNTRTYINYDNIRFWDNLKYAMPHKPDGTKRNKTGIRLDKVNGTALK